MLEFLFNIWVLIRKEILMIVKDKRGRIILVMPIITQTLLFGYVATYDLNRIEYALLDEDHSLASRELVQKFDASPIFYRMETINSSREIAGILDTKKALMVLHIGPQFERRLNAAQTVPVQVVVDGRNSNVAGTASGYASSIIEAFTKGRWQEKGTLGAAITVSSRAWFNPNLETRWNILSGLLAVLAVIQVMILAGQSVAREKEQGTFDQLLVTPFGPLTILFGKAIPPVMVGLVQSSLVLLVSLHWFAIPFVGSFTLLYFVLLIFNITIVGIGLCISALTSTMQQAMLYSFTLLMPMVLLSGFTTPISSMPQIFQMVTKINPVRYGVELAQRIYLEGAGISELENLLWPLGAIAVVTLLMASKLFHSRLE